jgi:hypothetical protein
LASLTKHKKRWRLHGKSGKKIAIQREGKLQTNKTRKEEER